MANKTVKETLYKCPLNKKWRYIKTEGEYWYMVRVKDGYYAYWSPDKLTEIK
jgi:hypothetical protein